MAAISDLERFLERVFERTSARVFRSRVQPVQVERRVERAMEDGRARRGEATLVPSRFRVRLNPVDIDDLAARSGGPEALAGRLADSALAFARLHGYHVAARPTVVLVADPSIERGRMEVDTPAVGPRTPDPGDAAPVLAGPRSVPAHADAPPAGIAPDGEQPAPAAPAAPVAPSTPTPSARPGPAIMVAEASVPAPGAQVAVATGIRSDGDRTLVYRRPAPEPARALLRVTSRDGGERIVEVDGVPVTIGRAPDNTLVLPDARVSRHHGRLQSRHGTLLYTDLDSTNGSRVNGIRVDEIVLGAGDRLQVGDTMLVVEHLPG